MPGRKQKTGTQVLARHLKNNARTLSGLALLSLLAVMLQLGAQWLSDPYRFPLNVVEVNGDFEYMDREQLQEAIAEHMQGGFFTVDVAAVCAAAEQLPWVYAVRVRRVWPDILRLHVEEQQPIARWGEQGFLNRFGESFVPGESIAAGDLPGLFGPAGQEIRVLEQYIRASELLAPLGMQISRLELDERRALHVQLEGGVRLELGRASTWQRLQRFARAYPAVFEGRMDELQRIDLRYSNGFSVNWRQAGSAVDGEQKV